MFELSRSVRLDSLPPYLFEEIDRRKAEALRAGRDVVDLGVGDPIEGPIPEIVEALSRAARRPDTHGYSTGGTREFREAIAHWFGLRFGVTLDPEEEVLPLIGSKEGLAHLPLALVDPGDRVLIPDPGYPVYTSATIFAGGEPVRWPLEPSGGFLPNLGALETARAKLAFLNYPNNPTTAVADPAFFVRAVAAARRAGTLLVNDAAYSEVTFDGYSAPSLIAAEGARESAVEAPRGTFFLWAPVPAGTGSLAFAGRLLDGAGVVVAPGVGFGSGGEGFVRLSMTSSLEGIERAVAKIAEIAPWR